MKKLLGSKLIVIRSLLVIGATPLWSMTNLPPVIVTASRLSETIVETAASVETIPAQTLFERQTRTVPEAWDTTTGIMVQKTSYGQGSPYIRGFTGFRTLMLVDGIRLNSPVFRDGANQYWGTVDSSSLESMELLKGPGSSLYGSDAVGGIVQAFTRMPEFAPEDGADVWGGRLAMRAASAERSITGRAEGEYGSDIWAGLFGVTAKHFGDLEGGRHVGRQSKTGYDELDVDAKVRVALKGDRELVFAHMNVDQDDVWRTHRTPYGIAWNGTVVGNELVHRFDQDRSLSYLRYIDREKTLLYDELQTTVYFQRQQEAKDVQKINLERSLDGFDVRTWGTAIDMLKETQLGTWAYGAEYIHDGIESYRTDYNANGTFKKRQIQGAVADDSAYHTVALYLQDRVRLSERWELTLGVRTTFAQADIGRYENQTTKAAASMHKGWFDCSAHTRLTYKMIEERWWVYGAVAQAFRAPNLSDLTRFDGSGSNKIETPAPDLDPEKYISGELGTRVVIDAVSWHAAYFHTGIRDMIIRRLEVDNIHYFKLNGSDGYVHGFESEVEVQIAPQWRARAGVTWMEGYEDHIDTGGRAITEPVRTMPLTGYTALRWESVTQRFWAESLLRAVDKEDRLTKADQQDTQRIPPGGTPGYMTAALRVGLRLKRGVRVVAAIENALDKDYRIHGSGSNEPGRNFILSLEYCF